VIQSTVGRQTTAGRIRWQIRHVCPLYGCLPSRAWS
jgi:hypothetical protein